MNTKAKMGDYRTEYTFETFSFLPQLTADEVYDQVCYILDQGWTPAIEHEAPERVTSHFWGLWKLPFFGMRDPNELLAEVEECRQAYPDHLIRVIGYDDFTQSQGHNFVVYRPRGL
ncbi:MAG: ribulose bisphosphate carboxylase small subunit [Pseudomonadota bacterium]